MIVVTPPLEIAEARKVTQLLLMRCVLLLRHHHQRHCHRSVIVAGFDHTTGWMAG